MKREQLADQWRVVVRAEDSPLVVTSSADSLADAIARLADDAAYYRIVCGYRITAVIERICGRCQGDKLVPKRRHGYRPCPHCKGWELERIGAIRFSVLTDTTLRKLRDQCAGGGV
jgi:hypothetical protein